MAVVARYGSGTSPRGRELEGEGQEIAMKPDQFSAAVAQLVERVLGKDEVLGSNPSGSFRAATFRIVRIGCVPWLEAKFTARWPI
jgi:hypothetical protein